MGLFIQQKDNRSKLQERLDAELREKARLQASGAVPVDQTKDSNYVKNTEMATGKGVLWFLLALAVAIAIIVTLFISIP